MIRFIRWIKWAFCRVGLHDWVMKPEFNNWQCGTCKVTKYEHY